MKKDYFVEKMLMNEDVKNKMQYRQMEIKASSFTWNKFPGFLAFNVTYDEEDYSIIIHSHALPEDEYCYSVTIGLKEGEIELSTYEIYTPLKTIIGNVIGSILASKTILEFTKVFEEFTWIGFHKF